MIYQPAEDSFLLLKCVKSLLPHLPKGAKVLDMGTGSGTIALEMAKARSDLEVHAVDISKESLAFVEGESKKQKLPVILHHSDLFSNVKGPFHFIAFNPPYLYREEGEKKDPTIHDDKVIERFIWQVGSFLTEDGSFLLLLSDAHPKFPVYKDLLYNLYRCELCKKENVFFEALYVFHCRPMW